MPLISVNLKDPGGLASHSNNISKCVARTFKDKNYADLSIVCRSGSIQCHQAMLESLSPRLREMFQAHNCCNCSGSSCGRREHIQVHLPDVSRETLKSLLDLVYTGKCSPTSATKCQEIQGVMKLLDLKLPGDFRQETTGVGSTETLVIDTPSSSTSSALNKRKRKRSDSGSEATSKVAKAALSPEDSLVEMAKLLLPFSDNKKLPCIIPGCGVSISHSDMTSHFQIHFSEFENKPIPCNVEAKPKNLVLFKCDKCGKAFKFRRALDNHKLKCNSEIHSIIDSVLNKKKGKEKFNEVFSSSDDESSTEEKSPTCKECNKQVKSDWHLHPSRHSCTVKVDKSPTKQENKPSPSKLEIPLVTRTCPVCKKECKARSVMKDHVLRNHYGEQVNELYPGQSCKICGKDFNMRVVYLRHLSHAHETLLEALLNNDGLALPPKSTETKVDEQAPAPALVTDDFYQCPKCSEKFKRRPNLKSHIARAHFKEKLSRTNPGTKCNICDEECDNQANIIKHITKKHEKVIQFLLNKEGLSLPAPENKAASVKTPNKSPQKNIDKEKIMNNDKLTKSEKNTERPHNSSHDDGKKAKNLKCPKCEYRCNTMSDIKGHIGMQHYRQKLSTTYPGKTCPMCEKEFLSEEKLLRHICKKHRKIIEFLLGKDGLSLPSPGKDDTDNHTNAVPPKKTEKPSESRESPSEPHEENMSELWRYNCLFCSKDLSKGICLAVRHYLGSHFKETLKKDSEGLKDYQCHICDYEAPSSKPAVAYYSHLGKHPEIIDKYLKNAGFFSFSPSFSIDECGYKAKKLRVDVSDSQAAKLKARSLSLSENEDVEENSPAVEVSEPEPEPEPMLPLEMLLRCFLCKKDFNTDGGVKGLLSHYSKDHYRLELEHNYITKSGQTWSQDRKCEECFVNIPIREDYLQHIGVEHRRVEQFLPTKYKLPPDSVQVVSKVKEQTFKCPVEDCDTEKETKKSLLVHLLMIHFNKNMELEYKETFQKMNIKKCPECSMSLLDNYLGFIKHLAVDHEKVMKYVKEEKTVFTKTLDEEPATDQSQSKPENSVKEEIAKAEESFDLRAILDSDSDSD